MDAQRTHERDRAEREAVIQKQLAERWTLQGRVKAVRAQQHESMQELIRDVAHYARLGRDAPDKQPASKVKNRTRELRKAGRERGGRRDDAPELEI